MSEVTIITNNVPRFIIEPYELTANERKDFDYLDWQALETGDDSASFFRYRGEVYDLGEFMRVEYMDALAAWHGYQSDSFFSGIVVRYCDDHESIVVGRYYS
jgi:hypothetical protein